MPRTPNGPPTYAALVRELERALACFQVVAAHTAIPGRLRFRVIRHCDRLTALIARAKGGNAS